MNEIGKDDENHRENVETKGQREEESGTTFE